jgi:DNA polymerase III epsilon subunit family exonuclease
MQLAFDSADRLVELVEEARAPVPAEEAARKLFALASAPAGLARELLDDVVGGDARLAWRAGCVALAQTPGADLLLEEATFIVVDLETTGLSPVRSRICELGAVRVRALELDGELETFVNPGERLPVAIQSLTGIRESDLRSAPPAQWAVRRFLDFAGDAVIVAHNARIDLAFLDREVGRLTGRRIAAPVVDTVSLAKRLLDDRTARFGLASLAWFFGTSVRPCHRALADAQATAEILLALLGLAQERGARTVADLVELSAPRTRRVYAKRSLAHGAPPKPGVYLFRDANDVVLYVGKARDLRARLRSYFRSDRQRPAVEAALGAVERIEWRVLGSELEASLEELKLIRELRPPANVRGKRTGVYLRRRGSGWVVSEPHVALKQAGATVLGPLQSRNRARLAARALGEHASPEAALEAARARVQRCAREQRFEDAARHRDRLEALEGALRRAHTFERLRQTSAVLLVPAVQDGFTRAFFVREGRVAAVRTLPPGAGARLELEAGVAEATRAELPQEDPDELLLVAHFLRRPPPELRVVPFAWVVRAAA